MTQVALSTQPHDAGSVYHDGEQEALRFKWIESERACCDLGHRAIESWVAQHWRYYLRARWLEHIQGKRFWVEFAPECFGALQRDLGPPLLVDRVRDRLEVGQENLDILQWAITFDLPIEPILQILAAVDVNSCRLSPRFLLAHN